MVPISGFFYRTLEHKRNHFESSIYCSKGEHNARVCVLHLSLMKYRSCYLKHHFVLKDVLVSTLFIMTSPLWGQFYANRTFDPSLYLSDSSQAIQKQHEVCENGSLKDKMLFQKSIHKYPFRPGSNRLANIYADLCVRKRSSLKRKCNWDCALISNEQHIWIVRLRTRHFF